MRTQILVIGAAGLLWAFTAYAAIGTPRTLAQAQKDGAYIFMHDHFGSQVRPPLSPAQAFSGANFGKTEGPRMTCSTCHANGREPGHLPNGRTIPSLVNAAAIFPRVTAAGQLRTLGREIRHCVRSGIKGRPPSYGGPVMVDLQAFLASLAAGKPLNPGGRPH